MQAETPHDLTFEIIAARVERKRAAVIPLERRPRRTPASNVWLIARARQVTGGDTILPSTRRLVIAGTIELASDLVLGDGEARLGLKTSSKAKSRAPVCGTSLAALIGEVAQNEWCEEGGRTTTPLAPKLRWIGAVIGRGGTRRITTAFVKGLPIFTDDLTRGSALFFERRKALTALIPASVQVNFTSIVGSMVAPLSPTH
jgi:hypothetical protein